jgi:hypothetical protein
VYDIMPPVLMFSPEYPMNDIRSIGNAMSIAWTLHDVLLEPTLQDGCRCPCFVHGDADLLNPLSAVQGLVLLIDAPSRELIVLGAGQLVGIADAAGCARILEDLVLAGLDG